VLLACHERRPDKLEDGFCHCTEQRPTTFPTADSQHALSDHCHQGRRMVLQIAKATEANAILHWYNTSINLAAIVD
jgi:hypothetical protein